MLRADNGFTVGVKLDGKLGCFDCAIEGVMRMVDGEKVEEGAKDIG